MNIWNSYVRDLDKIIAWHNKKLKQKEVKQR